MTPSLLEWTRLGTDEKTEIEEGGKGSRDSRSV